MSASGQEQTFKNPLGVSHFRGVHSGSCSSDFRAINNDRIPLLLIRLQYEADDPQTTLAEIRRMIEVLELAIAEADGLDGNHLMTH